MPDRHRAGRALPLEFAAREFPLRRSARGRDVRVQHQDQPVARRECVVAQARRSGGRAEVGEVRCGARGLVLVIAGHRDAIAIETVPTTGLKQSRKLAAVP